MHPSHGYHRFPLNGIFSRYNLIHLCAQNRIITSFPLVSDIEKLTTNAQAFLGGMELPFPYVHGTTANDKIYNEDGITKAEFPLKAYENYVYKNSFLVSKAYPKLQLVVHFALYDQHRKDVVCFSLPARIVN